MPFAATDRHVQCVDTRLGACHRTCCQLALGSPPTRRTALRGFPGGLRCRLPYRL